MKNVLMQVCRKTHNLAPRQVARRLDIPAKDYYDLETSKTIMTLDQAKTLEKLYNIHFDYFLESSRQLELLHTRKAVIKRQAEELNQLKQRIAGYIQILPPGYAELPE